MGVTEWPRWYSAKLGSLLQASNRLTNRFMKLMPTNRRILLCLVVILMSCILCWMWTVRDASQIKSHFGIQLPQGSIVIARRIDTFGFDGSVAWVVKLNSASADDWFLPEGFKVIPESGATRSKYQEVLWAFSHELPKAYLGYGKTKVFGGGLHGNSFIGIAETGDRFIMYRFWT